MAREPDRAAGAGCRALGSGSTTKRYLRMCAGSAKRSLRQRQLEIHEPAVAHRAGRGALRHRGALRRCSSSAAAAPRSARRPSPGRATHIRRLARAPESVCTGHHTNQAKHPDGGHDGQRDRGRKTPFQQSTHRVTPCAICRILQTNNRRQDGDCVRAQARCKYFRDAMAARLLLVSAGAGGSAGMRLTVTTLIPDESVRVGSLSSAVRAARGPGRAASTSTTVSRRPPIRDSSPRHPTRPTSGFSRIRLVGARDPAQCGRAAATRLPAPGLSADRFAGLCTNRCRMAAGGSTPPATAGRSARATCAHRDFLFPLTVPRRRRTHVLPALCLAGPGRHQPVVARSERARRDAEPRTARLRRLLRLRAHAAGVERTGVHRGARPAPFSPTSPTSPLSAST